MGRENTATRLRWQGALTRSAFVFSNNRLCAIRPLEERACLACGSCSGMFTANSMNCLCEALGIALPGNGTILAASAGREELARRAACSLMRLVRGGVRFRDIVTRRSLDNAVALDVAMGGSTNTVLHLLALAYEAEIDYDLARIDEVAHLTKVSPAWGGGTPPRKHPLACD